VDPAHKDAAASTIMALYDANGDGEISLQEFVDKFETVRLPDLGFGPGHHFDEEGEYEVHHFDIYHKGDDVKLEDLNHPEDIEHFKMHELEEEREEEEKLRKERLEQEKLNEERLKKEKTREERLKGEKLGEGKHNENIILANIPEKYLRNTEL
jgi:hypothetical protein